MGILSSFFDVVAGVSILAGRSSLLDTNLTTIAGRNFTVRGALGLSFLSIGFINLVATSRKQKKIERLTKDAEEFGAEQEIHQLIIYDGSRADTLVFENPDDIKDYLYEGLYGFENLVDEEWYIDDDEAAERKIKLGYENNAGFDKVIDDINRERFVKKTKNMSIDEVIEFLHFNEVYYRKTLVDLDKDFRVNSEDGGIKQAAFKDDNHGYGADTFSAEKEVYVLTFSDPMRNGKLVELPFLTYEEAQEYIEANIAPYNANKPFSQQIATRIIFPSEEYNAPAAVMRTYKGRKSPSISAKSVKVGTRKRGNDGKMWQVRSVRSRGKRTQRWFKD